MSDNLQSPAANAPQKPKRRVFVAVLPLLIFAALAGVFTWQLMSEHNAADIPSALIGKPAPQINLPPVEGMLNADGSAVAGITTQDLLGKVSIVNIWASWCVPCRDEHPALMKLAQDKRIQVLGFNYKDKPENARRFLQSLGSPYQAIGEDISGRAAIDWGVYGVPETFIVNREGMITYKFVGPLSDATLEKHFMPEVEKALGGTSATSVVN